MLKKISAIALLALACNAPKAPAPKPQPEKKPETATTKEPEKKPESAPASVAAEPKGSALQLSLVEPNGNKCDWKKVDPIANLTKVIATFDNDCRGASMTFSKDRSKVLAVFSPEMGGSSYSEDQASPPFLKDPGEPTDKTQRLFEVEISTGKITPIALPGSERGRVDGFAYVNGEVVAFFEQEAKVTNGVIEFEGKKLPVTDRDGVPVLVHAMKHSAGKWELFETLVSDTGWDMAQGVSALSAYQNKEKASTIDLLTEHPSDTKEVAAPILERLKTYAPILAARGGEWVQLAPSLLVWMFQAEFIHATGKIVFDDGAKFIDLPGLGFTDGDLVAPVVQGEYLLVAQNATGRSPRVYEIKTQKLLFSADNARTAIFWPK